MSEGPVRIHPPELLGRDLIFSGSVQAQIQDAPLTRVLVSLPRNGGVTTAERVLVWEDAIVVQAGPSGGTLRHQALAAHGYDVPIESELFHADVWRGPVMWQGRALRTLRDLRDALLACRDVDETVALREAFADACSIGYARDVLRDLAEYFERDARLTNLYRLSDTLASRSMSEEREARRRAM